MRDLFIKIDILSRTPTPDSDGASSPLDQLRTPSRQRTGFQEIDSIGGTVDKDKYIHEWLAVDAKSIKAEKSPSRPPSFKTEGRKIKMASSIVSKIKLYKVCYFSFLYHNPSTVFVGVRSNVPLFMLLKNATLVMSLGKPYYRQELNLRN